MQWRVSPGSSEVWASISTHFFLFLRARCPGALPLSLWELLLASEGISHWMAAFLPLVGNIFFKLALGSFEENPDIVEKRVRGQHKKKEREKERSAFFSACYKFAIQAKKNKHPDSATGTEVPWLDVVPSLVFPRPSALPKQGVVSHSERVWHGLLSHPPLYLSSLPCFPVDGQYMNRIPYPASYISSWFVRNVCSWGCSFNSVRHLLWEEGELRGQLIIISKWAKCSYHGLLPGLTTAPYEDCSHPE